MTTISLDLRSRVLDALREEPSSLKVGARFNVSAAFVRKLRAQVRRTGDPSPGRGSGKHRLILGPVEQRLRELITAHPDATLIELTKLLRKAAGVRVSETTMWRSLRRMGITRKKRPSTLRSAVDRT